MRAAEAAIELDRQLGQLDHLAVPLIVLAQIQQCHGDPNAALRYYEEARQLAEDIGEPQLLFPVYDGLGTLYLDLGDPQKAESFLIQANEVCERAGRITSYNVCYTKLLRMRKLSAFCGSPRSR